MTFSISAATHAYDCHSRPALPTVVPLHLSHGISASNARHACTPLLRKCLNYEENLGRSLSNMDAILGSKKGYPILRLYVGTLTLGPEPSALHIEAQTVSPKNLNQGFREVCARRVSLIAEA